MIPRSSLGSILIQEIIPGFVVDLEIGNETPNAEFWTIANRLIDMTQTSGNESTIDVALRASGNGKGLS